MGKIWDLDFQEWRKKLLASQSKDIQFKDSSSNWMQLAVDNKYSYQFDLLGVPIIQMPEVDLLFSGLQFRNYMASLEKF